jgi:Oxidoreductase family, NAD-binding Rossmann fold
VRADQQGLPGAADWCEAVERSGFDARGMASVNQGEYLRVGIIGTGAIAAKHAAAYRNIGFQIAACTNQTASKGMAFAEAHGAEFVGSVEELCRHPRVDYVDLCTFPNYRLPVVELCAKAGKHVLVQKPMAVDLATADQMIAVAAAAGIQLGVVSQHRFDDAMLFLKRASREGRLGRIFQADAYVKWFRSAEYYSRPGKGSWAVEGGGAHQSGYSPDGLVAAPDGTCDKGVWGMAAWCATCDPVRRCAEQHFSVCEWRDRNTAMFNRDVARLSRTHRDSWREGNSNCGGR